MESKSAARRRRSTKWRGRLSRRSIGCWASRAAPPKCWARSRTIEPCLRIGDVAKSGAEILRESAQVQNEAFPDARVHSPMILKTDAGQKELFMREAFGPICFIIATENTDQSIRLAAEGASCCGAITAGIYSKDEAVLAKAQDAMAEAGAPLSCNLTGQIYVNQAAAFSDFHVSGANPAGNATLCDGAFVAGRFPRGAESRGSLITMARSADLPLRSQTPDAWAHLALSDPLALLNDHAHLEKKAAANALELLNRWPEPNPPEYWVEKMSAIARDEVDHLAIVTRLIARRGGKLTKFHRNVYAERATRLGASR